MSPPKYNTSSYFTDNYTSLGVWQVQIIGNDSNTLKLHSGRHKGQIKFRECLLQFDSEYFYIRCSMQIFYKDLFL